jgi:hypothetical protein
MSWQSVPTNGPPCQIQWSYKKCYTTSKVSITPQQMREYVTLQTD